LFVGNVRVVMVLLSSVVSWCHQLRLNGRLLDTFTRPDIGFGIFFEYLRTDDPFSHDFLQRVVDGFPFLLAPLAQVHGITSSVLQAAPFEPAKEPAHAILLNVVGGALDAFSSHAAGLANAMHQGASDTAVNAAHAVHSAGAAMRHFGEEAERRRIAMWNQMVALSQQHPAEIFAQMLARSKSEGKLDEPEEVPKHEEIATRRIVPHGKIFRPTTSRWFGETMDAPDEIGPLVHHTMNKTILSLVHLYLLLILIVSFPPTNANKTRFVVRRSCKAISVSSSETSLARVELDTVKTDSCARRNDTRHTYADFVDTRGKMQNVAPEPPIVDDDEELYPGDNFDPAMEGRGPQRIHIDLGPTIKIGTECQKERRPSIGTNRFFPRPRRSSRSKTTHRSLSIDCPESERSSASDASGNSPGKHVRKNGSRSNNSNDKMKKSLSYFM
jgi:hypothetical protein